MLQDRKPISRHARVEQSSSMEDMQAEDHIKYIRDVMERTSTFTAVPGWGMMAMGLTAVAATLVASKYLDTGLWILVWFIDSLIAMTLGGIAMGSKAHKSGIPLQSGSGRKFIMGFLPALFAGLIISIGLWKADQVSMLPAVWMLLYGVGAVTGGAFSVRVVPVMGMAFLLVGAGTVFMPLYWGNMMMGVTFGGFHLLFGYIVARNHGG